MNVTKRCTGVLLFILIIFYGCIEGAYAGEGRPKNVILFVADGMGSAHTTIARWYKGSALRLDSMYIGGMRTYSADSLITDSAPAATALASGHKSGDKMIGIMPGNCTIPGVPDPGTARYKPVATILEGARLSGRRTGIIATSEVQHATPAAFSSHWPDRSDFDEIARQQVHQGIDVVLGGGRRFLFPKEKKGARKDGRDLTEVLHAKGYTIVTDRTSLLNANSDRLWGAFADFAMAYELDRKALAPGEPSLAEMTRKALEVLSKGTAFFLFVEGSKIDWASHAHDPVAVVGDVLAYDEAVGAALDFARKDGNTIVVAVSDHGNGGMSLGNTNSDGLYVRMQHKDLVALFKKATSTGEGIEKVLGERSDGNIRRAAQKHLGIDDLTEEEVNEMKHAKTGKMLAVTGRILSKRSHIGWTTHGHTGEDLFFYYHGIERPFAMLENSDIARVLAREMGFDLDEVDGKLFVDAGEAFSRIGASVTLDADTQGARLILIEKDGNKAQIITGTNTMKMVRKQEKVHELSGIAIFAPLTGKIYIPREAVAIFEGSI